MGSGTGSGARLRCVFQRLEGEATLDGLWLRSTATNAAKDRFRVRAVAVWHVPPCAPDEGSSPTNPVKLEAPQGFGVRRRSEAQSPLSEAPCSFGLLSRWQSQSGNFADSVTVVQDAIVPPGRGTVEVADKLVRFVRPGLVEEYSVSMDGVRQDFVVMEKPRSRGPKCAQTEILQRNIPKNLSRLTSAATEEGPLRVELAVTGAKVEPLGEGAQRVLEESTRKIAYSRLRVTDATGKELLD